MAIYHLSMKIISRSKGYSAVASAAYRAGEKILDERTGLTHDYTRKRGVSASVVLCPKVLLSWCKNRAQLWNEIEKAERRKDSQLAREIELAIPKELCPAAAQEIVRAFVVKNFVSRGMVADVAFHNLGGANPHAHIMLTMRECTANGFGRKITAWNEKSLAETWRASWASHANAALAKAGFQETIDHRSYQRQGIDREPGIHLGKSTCALEKRGLETERGTQNRLINRLNLEIQVSREALRAATQTAELTQIRHSQHSSAPAGAPTIPQTISVTPESDRQRREREEAERLARECEEEEQRKREEQRRQQEACPATNDNARMTPGKPVTGRLLASGRGHEPESGLLTDWIQLQTRSQTITFWGDSFGDLVKDYETGQMVTVTLTTRNETQSRWAMKPAGNPTSRISATIQAGEQMKLFDAETFRSAMEQICRALPQWQDELKQLPLPSQDIALLDNGRPGIPTASSSCLPAPLPRNNLTMIAGGSNDNGLQAALFRTAGNFYQGVMRFGAHGLLPVLVTPVDQKLVVTAITKDGPRYAGHGNARTSASDGSPVPPDTLSFTLAGHQTTFNVPLKQPHTIASDNFRLLGFQQTMQQWEQEQRARQAQHWSYLPSPGR
ncbi:TPA: MobA/MobL family protein [Escherichia coli]|nr:MobA/MobL family protein [Escherichia coli]